MKHKPYPKYKPSGIDWIGDIPEGWKIAKLKWFISIKSGDGIETEEIGVEGSYPVYGGNGIMGYTNNFNRYGNDMIIGRVGAKCGNVHLVEGKKWISDNALFLYNVKGFELQYLSLILRALNLNQYANQNAQPLITGLIVRQQIVTRPSIKEQKSISDFLDQKTAQIDDLIQKKEEMIKLLKEKRAAIINQAVTKGLDPNAKMKPSGIDWIGDIPEGWQKKRIKFVARINAKTLPENTDDNLEFYYIDIGNVSLEGGFTKGEKVLFSEAPSRARRIVQKGDTIISTVRTYLKAIAYIEDDSEELIASTGFAVISPSDEINEKYFFNTLCSERVVQTISAFSVGVSYPAINASEIGDIFIVYPDKQGQEKITDYINKKTAEIDKLIKNVIGAIAKLREYRSSLITAAVTGKIDIRG